ncbi:hypothetical protein ACQ4LE_001991 [Meloidogyne hapla]|uniref:UBX domain-containing protein n=1 Tax=Meloidogyne hapla TaxID=6305 RepID=A0A1I8BYQ2_MELHA
MDKIKAFIKKKKADKNFKLAGPGYVLKDDNTQSSSSKHSPKHSQQSKPPPRPDATAIAQAAERRMAKSAPQSELTPMQKIIKLQAKKELEEEQRKLAEQMQETKVDDISKNITKNEQSSILFTCELFGEDEALPKSEMLDAIGSCLFEQLEDGEADPLYTTTCIIHTLNKENIKIPALDTIQRYLQNIIDNPNEQKFRRIKLSNKVYQEKVLPCTGAFEFLIATGFRKEELKSSSESSLVLDSLNIKSIEQSLSVLFEGKSVAIKLFRDRKVFIIDPNKPLPELTIPSDFFSRTADEILREQQQRTEALERMTTLRTQKMREMDSVRSTTSIIYKYTLIRVRFPNNYLIQAIFNVHEKFQALREFVFKNLALEYGSFTLIFPSSSNNNGTDSDKENCTFLELGLVPSAILNFKWDRATIEAHSSDTIRYLKEELEESAIEL